MLETGELRCDRCGDRLAQWSITWRCASGGTLSWRAGADGRESPSGPGIWRRPELLPPVLSENRVVLGETETPVLERGGGGRVSTLSPPRRRPRPVGSTFCAAGYWARETGWSSP